jgi:hypothetical protein
MGQILFPLDTDKFITKLIKKRKNVYILNDALLNENSTKEGHFFSIHEDTAFEKDIDNVDLTLQIMLRYDSRIKAYERTLRNSIDVFEDIEGIFEIVKYFTA